MDSPRLPFPGFPRSELGGETFPPAGETGEAPGACSILPLALPAGDAETAGLAEAPGDAEAPGIAPFLPLTAGDADAEAPELGGAEAEVDALTEAAAEADATGLGEVAAPVCAAADADALGVGILVESSI